MHPRSHLAVATLAALAGCTAANANPVSWFNNAGPINSRGLLGNANNAVLVTPPIPAIAPGGGTGWRYLTISGSLTKAAPFNTYAAESCIEVTLPSGEKFVIKPFQSTTFNGTIPIPAGAAVASPIFMASNGGVCTLRFFELFADNAAGADATWSNLSITLHDELGGDESPFQQSASTTPANPDYDYDGNWIQKAGSTTGQFNFSTTRVVDSYRFKGYGTAMCGWNANNSISPLNFASYAITADRADGAGTVTWTHTPFAQYAASTSTFDITVNTPVPVLTGAAHPWAYTLTETGAPVANGTRLGAIWLSIQPIGPDAPAATDLGVIRGKPSLGPAASTVVKDVTFNAVPSQVYWYTFTTEQACSNASGYWLDIHSQIPAGSPIIDHEMGVYSTTGNRLANDDDGGSVLRSMLTFGSNAPLRAPVDPSGGPAPRDGHHGILPAGVHYLAISELDTIFADTGWYVTSNGALTGAIAFEFRTNLPPLPCGPADVGGQGGTVGGDGVLDNNDFIVFIDNFFAQVSSADVGVQGGIPGADGHFDNNDFVVFINDFFAGCN